VDSKGMDDVKLDHEYIYSTDLYIVQCFNAISTMYIYETRRKFQIYKGGEFEIT
jgi:hypothetical protein